VVVHGRYLPAERVASVARPVGSVGEGFVTLAEASRQFQNALEAYRLHESPNTFEQLEQAEKALFVAWMEQQ
jgi:hypothetical protein